MIIQAVLFDIDGTLVDSNDAHVCAWREVFAAEGFDFDEATIHAQVGKGTDMLVPALLPDADEPTVERLGEAHGELFKSRYLPQVAPFPGAKHLLERVQASGRRVVLATSASKPELEHHMELLEAKGLVFAATSADDVEHTKPAPDVFAAALAKLAPVSAAQAVVVGDTPYDVLAAGKCGIAAVGLRSGGFGDAVLTEAGAVAIYDDVAQLLAEFDSSPLAK